MSWLDLPETVKQLLIQASENWENTQESQKYMNEALAQAGDNLDVLIGAYRYFFYKSNVAMALEIAHMVMEKIKQQEHLPEDWEPLKPILVARKEDPKIRLYLNAYAATGFVLARLNRIAEAQLITGRIKAIDENREFCATTVFEVLTQPDEDEED